jgi:4-amino-4-deoxy-L-arabinose transferase-like glycosyltransferase
MTPSDSSSSFFGSRPWLLRVTLLLLILVAGAVRLYHINSPGVLIDREYTSAVFARAFYLQQNDSAADWQQEVANITKDRQPVLEPPITEFLVAQVYRLIGSEQLWAAHLVTIVFWLVGAIFLFQTAVAVVSIDAAVIALIYYLFTPLSILLSRSFQPDALMMMLYLISLYAIVRYDQQPTVRRVLVAGIFTGLALLVRPLILFVLLGAFTAVAIQRHKSWRFFLHKEYLLYMALSLLPSLLYYGYGIFIAGYMRWKVASSFRPHLYLHAEYWQGWLQLTIVEIGLLVLFGALLGLPLLRPGMPRVLLTGLWLGYIAFGLTFTMHIHTHGYYQAQLIPIVALSFSALIVFYLNHLHQSHNKWYVWLPVGTALLIFLYLDVQLIRTRSTPPFIESPQVAQEIGEWVQHSDRTVFVSRFYGMPLQYYGQFSGTRWPKSIEYWLYRRPDERELSLEERLNGFGYEPEYFVITDFREFTNRYADLKSYLHEQCSLLVQDEHYLIYDGNCTQ